LAPALQLAAGPLLASMTIPPSKKATFPGDWPGQVRGGF